MTRPAISSTPLLRTTLRWAGVLAACLAVVGALVGFAVAGTDGAWSALVAVLIGAVFLAMTALSILIANRWYGDPLYVPIFFGTVMGGWVVKFGVFIVVLLVLRDQPWLNGTVFFIFLVVTVLGSLAVDAIVMMRMRIPHVSDVALPSGEQISAAEEDSGEDGH
ncbi:hypothetical protein [Microbacterium sp.]|uniref:hypothetical protein n=1 Tax=Microbacterium sp. TaxID=51671 RepID=UPI003A846337